MSNSNYNPLEMPHELTPELKAYYNNRPLLWRNIWWFMTLNIGWGICFTLVGPLMTLRMNSAEIGMGESMIGSIIAVNAYAVSFLVMYFSWKSDHTISRWGRRIPFLWISAPFIISSVLVFPFIHDKWILLVVVIIQLFFMDMNNSTISLLPIDLVPRNFLARVGVIPAMVMGVLSFFVLRYGMKLSDMSETLPYLIGGGVMLCTSLLGGLNIKEPPIRTPATESFKPWSALKVGWRDRRIIVLMLAVPMIGALPNMYNAWVWLMAKNELHLTRTEMGASLAWASIAGMILSFPVAWMVDRISPYKLAAISLSMNVIFFIALMRVNSANDLILASLIFLVANCFNGVASIMVFRSAHPAEVGSVTSSLALVNNAFNATMMLVSGQLIERLGHNYKAAFVLGLSISAMGFGMLLLYRHLMKKGRHPAAAPVIAQVMIDSTNHLSTESLQ